MITNKVEYLLMILMDLAGHRDEGYVLSRDIAERQGIPAKYLPQLMALLTKKGWVSSARGAGGGVKLAVDPGLISVRDVIDVSGDRLLVKPCVDEGYFCAKKSSCPLHALWVEAQSELNQRLSKITLADLVGKRARGGGNI